MIDVLVWNKYTRVVMQLAERLNISPEKALHLFYNSKVYALLLNKQYPLIRRRLAQHRGGRHR